MVVLQYSTLYLQQEFDEKIRRPINVTNESVIVFTNSWQPVFFCDESKSHKPENHACSASQGIEAIRDRLGKSPRKRDATHHCQPFQPITELFEKGWSAKSTNSKTDFLSSATEQLMKRPKIAISEYRSNDLSQSRSPAVFRSTCSPMRTPLFSFTKWNSGSLRARDVFECVWLEQIGSRSVEMKPRSWYNFYGQSFIQLAGRQWKQDNIWRSHGVTQTTWRTTNRSDARWTKQRDQVWRLG